LPILGVFGSQPGTKTMNKGGFVWHIGCHTKQRNSFGNKRAKKWLGDYVLCAHYQLGGCVLDVLLSHHLTFLLHVFRVSRCFRAPGIVDTLIEVSAGVFHHRTRVHIFIITRSSSTTSIPIRLGCSFVRSTPLIFSFYTPLVSVLCSPQAYGRKGGLGNLKIISLLTDLRTLVAVIASRQILDLTHLHQHSKHTQHTFHHFGDGDIIIPSQGVRPLEGGEQLDY
jgi:hypothetical protein